MKRRSIGRVLAICVAMTAALFVSGGGVLASPSEYYVGGFYGEHNLPPGCIADSDPNNPDNRCYHQKVGLNALDTPNIDVAILVPVSPTAEQAVRIIRQAVEAWQGGIHYLAGQMGMPWLRDGVHFTINVKEVDLSKTHPDPISLVDPEIVIIASQDAGGIGLGIDPVAAANSLQILPSPAGVPCMRVDNPFSMKTWKSMPGFDGHDAQQSKGLTTGLDVQNCGLGGSVCFSVNNAIDPVPGNTDLFGLFDLVTHETGHCLTEGHVGDGADGPWGPVPTPDIMAYSYDPPGQTKCVSTEDVETFAIAMSKYLDTNGDGKVDASDRLVNNDPRTTDIGSDGFQVQDPYYDQYASGTGDVWDCPQPNMVLLPGPDTNFEPAAVATTKPTLTVSSPANGTTAADGAFTVAGTVDRTPLVTPVTNTSVDIPDAAGDAKTATSDIQDATFSVSGTTVTAKLKVGDLSTAKQGLVAYAVTIGTHRFESVVNPKTQAVETVDSGTPETMPDGWSTWDSATNTVTFAIPRSYLHGFHDDAPYRVSADTQVDVNDWTSAYDDHAPDTGARWVTGDPLPADPVVSSPWTPPAASTGGTTTTQVLQQPEGNTFTPADSTAPTGIGSVATKAVDSFSLSVPAKSDVRVELTWDDPNSDLQLSANGVGSSANAYDYFLPSPCACEKVDLTGVSGTVTIKVDPRVISAAKVTYKLTAFVTDGYKDSDGDGVLDRDDACPSVASTGPHGCPDPDGDGVGDPWDQCPTTPGTSYVGCPVRTDESVTVYVDGTLSGSARVDTSHGQDSFSLPIQVASGTHTLKTVWDHLGNVIATNQRTVTRP